MGKEEEEGTEKSVTQKALKKEAGLNLSASQLSKVPISGHT